MRLNSSGCTNNVKSIGHDYHSCGQTGLKAQSVWKRHQLGLNELTALFLFIILLTKKCAQCLIINDGSIQICVFSLYIDSYSHVLHVYHDHTTTHQRDFLNWFKTTLYWTSGVCHFSGGILAISLIVCWQTLPKYLL